MATLDSEGTGRVASYDDRIKSLREDLLREAVRAVSAAKKTHGSNVGDVLVRLGEVLGFAEIVLTSTEGALAAEKALTELEAHLGTVRDSVVDQPGSAEAWSSSILMALSYLPPARGQDAAQEARKAAESFQRSSSRRLTTLKKDIWTARAEAQQVEEHVTAQRAELDELVQQRKSEIDQQVEDIRTSGNESRQLMEAAITEHAETFRAAQEERSSEFNAALEDLKTQVEEMMVTTSERAQQHVKELDRMEVETKRLVEAIGDYGTGGRYAKEVRDQKRQADAWRIITVIVVLVAALVALWATRHAGAGIDDPRFVSKVLISVALGGLSGYTAKQSSRHRRREESARALELDMAVFPAFIERMSDEAQQAAREKILDRNFGRRLVPADPEQDGGPTLVKQLEQLARRSGRDDGPRT